MQIQDWKLLNVPYSGEIEEVLRQQHQAVQFIAMVGKYLIPQEDDDSNTNMQYLPESGLLAGNALSNGLRLALDLHHMSLCFRDSIGKCFHKILLIGKTKYQVFEELKKSLGELEMDVSTFKNELHFEIPVHSLEAGAKFSANSRAAVEENVKHRHNTELIFRNIASLYQEAYPVRVWPHHFDTGTIIPVDVNKKGK